jgi:hypothetical protein
VELDILPKGTKVYTSDRDWSETGFSVNQRLNEFKKKCPFSGDPSPQLQRDLFVYRMQA